MLGLLVVTISYMVVRQTLEPRDGLLRPAHVLPKAINETLYPNDWKYSLAVERAAHVRAVYQRDTLNNVRLIGGLAALGFGLVGTGVGWRAAGYVLRPVTKATETARRVAQSHDLTERIAYSGPKDEIKELADIFDTMLGRLARSFDGQRRFVANASHELRTPLTINRTLVDVAVRRPDATEDVKRLGESLLLVNARHERLIDGLLALAEGEQTILNLQPFDLTDVVEHVMDQGAKEAEEREIALHRLLDTAPASGDPVLLERLVQNLVENAIRHNHPGGEVWVTTRQRADQVELVVANTGLAVPAYEIETIFQPFRRLHGDRLNSERGSGLGLSIVRVIAEAHRGTVIARPREEGGLTVTVELPIAAQPSG
ncbi:sensor histidine kinase [Sinosporangium album]|uniref:sensor histidine kinase n=1 Tax=Sinosporangium album TaxID=504805 RepID=UPI001C40B288|nr:HAMP domain-containing sensor histidine kinase [Sinosporangium album]